MFSGMLSDRPLSVNTISRCAISFLLVEWF